MRTIAHLVFPLFVLCSAALARTSGPDTQANSLQPGSSKVVDGTYVNGALGFSYSLPSLDWYVNEAEGPSAAGGAKPLPGGSLLLLVADRHTGTPYRDRLLLIAEDRSHYSSSLTLRDFVA